MKAETDTIYNIHFILHTIHNGILEHTNLNRTVDTGANITTLVMSYRGLHFAYCFCKYSMLLFLLIKLLLQLDFISN